MGTRGEHTRGEIIEAANNLFYQRGNINHYFRTKDDMLAAVIEQRASEYAAALADRDRQKSKPCTNGSTPCNSRR